MTPSKKSSNNNNNEDDDDDNTNKKPPAIPSETNDNDENIDDEAEKQNTPSVDDQNNEARISARSASCNLSVNSTGSKTSPKKKSQRTKRQRIPPVGDVTIPVSRQHSNSFQRPLLQLQQQRRPSLSNSQRSQSHDSVGSVASNLSTSSRRVGLMRRLLQEMHLIENECFDGDRDESDDDDDNDENENDNDLNDDDDDDGDDDYEWLD